MTLSFTEPGPFAGDHISTQSSKASDWRPEGDAGRTSNFEKAAEIELEWSFFLSLGWPPPAILDLERQARNARASLIQTAIASGALKASAVYDRLSRMLSFAGGGVPRRLHLPGAPSKAWLLLERPLPLASPGEASVVAVNGQSFSIHQLIALSQKLGSRSRHLKIMTRQDLIDSLTRSYGRVFVRRAVAGLMRARPEWSAKTGLAPWQVYAGVIAAGVCSGAACVAPQEALSLLGGFLSLFFCLAILLRLAAVLSLVFPPAKKRKPRLLSDAELPRYTVLVPLFKEERILPYLAKALANLDYPGILAHLPEEFDSIRP